MICTLKAALWATTIGIAALPARCDGFVSGSLAITAPGI